eukprot:CAMPEP_0172439256 /NCGR_PEP_ID=MMETSP1065-20121228/306_1 /TAXON_ID=265537 /ORGANISM="Amphiprora paludosa, Strain CCMP125" /LENGTH=54 /DNA_ID=CAMNT_0013187909 /DNA_START=21 /DNA_END=182 /DNA_ORIENTATION=-
MKYELSEAQALLFSRVPLESLEDEAEASALGQPSGTLNVELSESRARLLSRPKP